jgi:hypothetical protein
MFQNCRIADERASEQSTSNCAVEAEGRQRRDAGVSDEMFDLTWQLATWGCVLGWNQ